MLLSPAILAGVASVLSFKSGVRGFRSGSVQAEGGNMNRVRGRVAWYSDRQGFGFITRQGGPDLFLHCSQLPEHVPAILRDGAEVEFEEAGPEGRHADRVTLVESAAAE